MGKRNRIILSGSGIATAAVVLVMSSAVYGLVLHPVGEPDMGTWTDHPNVAVVGRVHYYDVGTSSNYYGSCVAIAPNFVITARHVRAEVGSSVYFGGVEYKVRAVWYEPSADGLADLRVCGISRPDGEPANLSEYVGLYTTANESGKDIVMGGYGGGRGGDRPVGGPPYYGYAWVYSNTTQRWGQNEIDGYATVTSGSYVSKTVIADFDAPGVGGARPYEAALAVWDSGGGWFIYTGGVWKLAGVSAYVSRSDESWYNPSDALYAIRISSYYTWINEVLAEGFCMLPMEADITGDCKVDVEDLSELAGEWLRNDCSVTNNWCDGADYGPQDGMVNMYEFCEMASEWLLCHSWPVSDCE
jgi:hypothetical protein